MFIVVACCSLLFDDVCCRLFEVRCVFLLVRTYCLLFVVCSGACSLLCVVYCSLFIVCCSSARWRSLSDAVVCRSLLCVVVCCVLC